MPFKLPVVFFISVLTLAPALAAPSLTGQWALDTGASDDPEEAFDGKLRRESFPVPQGAISEHPSAHDASQNSYWETVRRGKERGSLKDLRRLGTAYPLVKAVRLGINAADGGYVIVYDDELPRDVRPNPKGRVFSASGEELVADSFGYTLSYWDGATLVLEADGPEGGKVTERLTVHGQPQQLEYVVKVDLRILEEPVTLRRVFLRDDTGARSASTP